MSGNDIDRLKVHRRRLLVDARPFTVLSPRPDAAARYATTRRPGSWRIATDVPGARLLGRMVWAMAFQRGAPTLTVIDQPFLVPADADAPDPAPIVIVNTELATPSRDGFVELRARLPLASSPSEGTVRLQTRGLDLALTEHAAGADGGPGAATPGPVEWSPDRPPWTDEVEGLVVLAAGPAGLRDWAIELSLLGGRPDA